MNTKEFWALVGTCWLLVTSMASAYMLREHDRRLKAIERKIGINATVVTLSGAKKAEPDCIYDPKAARQMRFSMDGGNQYTYTCSPEGRWIVGMDVEVDRIPPIKK